MAGFHFGTGFWKPRDTGFRYLHDEISGGVAAYSHLLTRAAYTGDCVTIGTSSNHYGFVDGLVPISQISTDYPANASVFNYYDQFGVNTASRALGLPNGWDINNGNTFLKGTATTAFTNTGVSGALASLGLGAYTILCVYKNPNAYTNEYIFQGNSINTFRLYAVNSTRFLWRHGVDASNRIDWDNIPLNLTPDALNLRCFTYDGSEDNSGMKCYENDMVNEITGGTRTNTGTFTNTAIMPSLIDLSKSKGVLNELHFFNKVLSQSERETAKAILQQGYPSII